MAGLVLDNATLWIGDGHAYGGHLIIADGKIQAVNQGSYRGPLPTANLNAAPLSPGLIDLMVLGGFDLSIMRNDPLDIARQYLALGVTSLQTCTGTLPWEGLNQVAANTRNAQAYHGSDAARVIGFYPEGPFQDPDLTGGSSREYAIAPSPQNVQRILDELGDAVTMINVSPGTPGDAAAVKRFVDAGRIVSMAHSNAPADRVKACVDAGTTVLGHTWDNNAGLIGDSGVQQPTIEHVALTDERVQWLHLISDGTHVHPIMIQLMLRCRGLGAICLVTDCNQKSGCADGSFFWDDGREFYKKAGVCRVKETDGLAGSATFLPDDFRNFVKFTQINPADAIRTVTYNPARSVGLDDQIGLLAPGRCADLVLWDDALRITRVWRAGTELKNVSDFAEVTV